MVGRLGNCEFPFEGNVPTRRTMAVTEETRHRLHQSLERVLGEEQAATLMEHLPPVGWADVATKQDLAGLREVSRADLAALSGELRADMADLRTELKGEMAELRVELKTEMADLRTELKGEMADLRMELKGEIGALRTEMANLDAGLRAELSKDRRVLMFGLLGSNVSIVAGIVIAASLFH
jgi:ribosomal protein L29